MPQMFSQQQFMQLLLRFLQNFEEHIEFDDRDVFYSTENKFLPSKTQTRKSREAKLVLVTIEETVAGNQLSNDDTCP